jgi:hypothetical protein
MLRLVTLAVCAALLGIPSNSVGAEEQEQEVPTRARLTLQGCRTFAQALGIAALLRDKQADVDAYVKHLHTAFRESFPPQLVAVLDREVRRTFASSVKADDIAASFFYMCTSLRGDILDVDASLLNNSGDQS